MITTNLDPQNLEPENVDIMLWCLKTLMIVEIPHLYFDTFELWLQHCKLEETLHNYINKKEMALIDI